MENVEVRNTGESDKRTILQAYTDICNTYLSLGDYLGKMIPTLPDSIGETYSKVRESSDIIVEYFRGRAERVQIDAPLSEKIGTPGYDLIHDLEILSDMVVYGLEKSLEHIQEGDTPIGGNTETDTLIQMANTMKFHIRSGYEDASLFPEPPSLSTKEDYILMNRANLAGIITILQAVCREIRSVKNNLSPVLKNKYETTLEAYEHIQESVNEIILEEEDISLEEAEIWYEKSKSIAESMLDLLSEKNRDYRIEEIDGKRRIIEYKSEREETISSAISELAKIAKSKKSSQIQVPKDIWKAQINSVGDTLAYIQNESTKKKIQALQKKGKLLAGTLEGLSGGTAQLKVFTIALARTLNEQSKYYKTEEDWSGVPKKLIPAIMGEEVEIEKKDSVTIGKEKRPYPYILVSYEDMAKKMSKTGKISGGKDIEYIKDYIEELSGKEYLLDKGGNQIIGVRFLNKLMTIYTKDRGTEVGCLLQLSPQFSKSMGGYTGLRSDTIQLLGGGKQKDITMDLFDLLIYYRGIPGNVYRVSKKELLSRYESKPTYMSGGAIRRTKLEKDFQNSIEKIKEAKVITKYKEEKTPGGEVSVFTFSKEEYLVGDDIEEQ